MKTIARGLIVLSILLLPGLQKADAGVWPFSRSDMQTTESAGVNLDYLHINRMAVSDSERNIVVYSQLLQDGMVFVRGRAKVVNGALDSVYYSTDAKQSWQKAAFLANETISFGFRPEPGQTYDLYVKLVDKNLQTNRVDQTHRVITVSDQDIESLTRTAVDAMIDAYEAEDTEAFMRHVAEDFAGERQVLESAVRQDFTLLDDIDLQVSISGIATGPQGHVAVTLTYSRFVVSARSGKPVHDQGMTQLIFAPCDGVPKVYSMKHPLLFGVSNAAIVADGTAAAAPDAPFLVVTDSGEIAVKPFEDAMGIINGVGPEAPSTDSPHP